MQMLDLIDRKSVLKTLENSGVLSDFAKFLIERQPAVNAVPVVIRCKDCRAYKLKNGTYWCTLYGVRMNSDDFCSYGNRKDG